MGSPITWLFLGQKQQEEHSGIRPTLCSCRAAQTHTGHAPKEAGTPCDTGEVLAQSRQQNLVCNERGLERAATLKKTYGKKNNNKTQPCALVS